MSSSRIETPVRIGSITILTLLIIICLATLGVLTLSTAQANGAAAEKQSESVQALYDNESSAQSFVADVDALLVKQKAAGAEKTAAMKAVSSAYGKDVTVGSDTITRKFTSENRTLTVKLQVKNNLSYQITEWSTTTESTNEQVTLWSGSGNSDNR